MNATTPHPFIPEEPSYEIALEIEVGADEASPREVGLVYSEEEIQALEDLHSFVQFIKKIAPRAIDDPRMQRYSAEAGLAFIAEREELLKRWLAIVRSARPTGTAEDL